MIQSVQITRTVIEARITSGTRKTFVSIKSNNRVKAFFVGIQGPKGARGDNGTGVIDPANFIIGETPSGAIDGSNATFEANFDFIPETVNLFANGLAQRRIADFNTAGTKTILLTESPGIGESISVNYLRS